MGVPPWSQSSSQLFALVTGANGGLGYSTCARLIEEFLTSASRAPTSHLVLIVTTRSELKTRLTISRLRNHVCYLTEHDSAPTASAWRRLAALAGEAYDPAHIAARVHVLGAEVDMCSIRGVHELADRLVRGTVGSPDALTYSGLRRTDGTGKGLTDVRVPRLDVVVLNAGMGGWSGINWPMAVVAILTNLVQATTWPPFKVANVGTLVRKTAMGASEAEELGENDDTQKLVNGEGNEKTGDAGRDEPVLGEVFASNVLGHYILSHQLMPLLSNATGRESGCYPKGRVIWISSVEAVPETFDIDDIQGLKSLTPYESSKRLTDILALTYALPNVKRAADSWFRYREEDAAPAEEEAKQEEQEEGSAGDRARGGQSSPATASTRPKLYVAHPGICATEIVPLNFFLHAAMTLVFYLARWLGSAWHTVDSYNGACAPVWLALADQQVLDGAEAADESRKGKWGSSTGFAGETRVRRTEVGGWGWAGVLGDEERNSRGRKRGAAALTREHREQLEVDGRRVWEEMERIRVAWEVFLGRGSGL